MQDGDNEEVNGNDTFAVDVDPSSCGNVEDGHDVDVDPSSDDDGDGNPVLTARSNDREFLSTNSDKDA